MARPSQPLRLLLLASVMSSTVSAWSAAPMRPRDTTCSASGLQACPVGLPSDFCCPSNTACIALAGNTTALCCPEGQTCDKIQPITCDINQQNPDQNPSVAIKTTVFNVALQTCGTGFCCPFGYSCSSSNQCTKNQDQSKPPSPTTSSSSTTTSSSSSGTSTATTTTTTTTTTTSSSSSSPSSSSPSNQPTASTTTSAMASGSTAAEASESGSPSPKTISIIGGAVGGSAVLILMVVVAILCIRRRNCKNQDDNEKAKFTRLKDNNSSGPSGNVISEPILHANSYRADFILKSPSASSSISQKAPNPLATDTRSDGAPRLSIPNPFDSPNTSGRLLTPLRGSVGSNDDLNVRTGQVVGGARLAPIRTMRASSTRVVPEDVKVEPGSQTINIVSEPVTVGKYNDRRDTSNTTFTDMMYEADLGEVRRGKPYVPATTPKM